MRIPYHDYENILLGIGLSSWEALEYLTQNVEVDLFEREESADIFMHGLRLLYRGNREYRPYQCLFSLHGREDLLKFQKAEINPYLVLDSDFDHVAELREKLNPRSPWKSLNEAYEEQQ